MGKATGLPESGCGGFSLILWIWVDSNLWFLVHTKLTISALYTINDREINLEILQII